MLVLCLLAMAGGQLYWLKRGADMNAFTADHQRCVETAGTAMADDRVLVNVAMYKACLRAHDWTRETGSRLGNPPGYYRGLEEEGPVRMTDVPEQTPSMERPRRR
jgi:hypothetical protein